MLPRPAQCGGISGGGRHEGGGGQGQQQPRGQQPSIARRQRGEQVGQGEAAHGKEQQPAPLQTGGNHGNDRRADGIGEGERGDQITGGRQPHIQVARQGGQQGGNHEALRADREGAEGQRKKTGQ